MPAGIAHPKPVPTRSGILDIPLLPGDAGCRVACHCVEGGGAPHLAACLAPAGWRLGANALWAWWKTVMQPGELGGEASNFSGGKPALAGIRGVLLWAALAQTASNHGSAYSKAGARFSRPGWQHDRGATTFRQARARDAELNPAFRALLLSRGGAHAAPGLAFLHAVDHKHRTYQELGQA